MAYNLLPPVRFIVAQSMASSSTSVAKRINFQDNIGIQINWTGVPVGSFSVQISNDHTENGETGLVLNAGNFITLPLSPTITAIGSANSAYIDLNQMTAQWLELVYTRISGTGSFDAYLVAKGV